MQIRESIKSLFPNRDCFCLVRPHNEERMLAQLESLPSSQLRKEFVEVRSPRWALLHEASAAGGCLPPAQLLGPASQQLLGVTRLHRLHRCWWHSTGGERSTLVRQQQHC